MGNGKKGQLGHGSLASEDRPKIVKFLDSLKTFHPIQISASFNSSIILFNHKKVIWFGTNGSICNQLVPTILDLKDKVIFFTKIVQFIEQLSRICSDKNSKQLVKVHVSYWIKSRQFQWKNVQQFIFEKQNS
jgi:hypothetical protein